MLLGEYWALLGEYWAPLGEYWALLGKYWASLGEGFRVLGLVVTIMLFRNFQKLRLTAQTMDRLNKGHAHSSAHKIDEVSFSLDPLFLFP